MITFKSSLRLAIMVSVLVIQFLFTGSVAFANADRENTLKEFEDEVTVPDPLEPINRVTYVFNDRLYFWIVKPVATVYKTILPPGIRQGIANAFDNIRTPVRFFNNLFQGKPDYAFTELGRFLINSTLGIGGFFDIAKTHFGLDKKEEDFGQTLAVYKVKSGPYINWPVLGPSTARDTLGTIVDIFLDPLTFIVPNWVMKTELKASEITNHTSIHLGEYEDLKKSALDPYVALRDAYVQNREKKIKE